MLCHSLTEALSGEEDFQTQFTVGRFWFLKDLWLSTSLKISTEPKMALSAQLD